MLGASNAHITSLSLSLSLTEREREKMQHVTWRNAQTDMCETCFGINH